MTMPISAAASLSVAGSATANGGPSSNSSFPYGLSMRFQVTVGALSLGAWSACKGLKVELKTIRAAEGGNYWSERVLPEKITYSTITLERAVHPQDSKAVQNWLQEVASKWMNYAPPDGAAGTPYSPTTARIWLLGAYNRPVMDWTLINVYPVSWTGPSLSATENKVAIETLELAHEGFLNGNAAEPGQ